MGNALKGLAASKKFWIFVIGVAVVVLNRTLDLGLTGEDLAVIGGGSVSALLGVGLADFGKEKATVMADALTKGAGANRGAEVDSTADPL